MDGRVVYDGIRFTVKDPTVDTVATGTSSFSYPYGLGDYLFVTEADGTSNLADNTDYVCQVFKAPPVAEDVDNVMFKLYQANSADGTVQTQIVNVNQSTESQEPDETDVIQSSGTVAANSLTTNTTGSWSTFTLTSTANLTANTLYGALIKRVSSTTGNVYVLKDTNGGIVDGDTRYIWKGFVSVDGSTWASASHRYVFNLYHSTTPLCRSMVTRLEVNGGEGRFGLLPILNRDGGKIQYAGRDNKRVSMEVLLQGPSTSSQGVQLLFTRLDSLKTGGASKKLVVEGSQTYQLDIPVDDYWLTDWNIVERLAGTTLDVWRIRLDFLEDTN